MEEGKIEERNNEPLVGKVMFEVDDDDYSSGESEYSSRASVSSTERKVRTKTKRYRKSKSNSTDSLPEIRLSSGKLPEIKVSGKRRPSLSEVHNASSYFKNKSNTVPPKRTQDKKAFQEEYNLPPFETTTEMPKGGDFVIDEIASKFLFETSTVDETLSAITSSPPAWEMAQQKKKQAATCYISVCFAFIVGVFLMYGYYEGKRYTSDTTQEYTYTVDDAIPYLKQVSANNEINAQAFDWLKSQEMTLEVNNYVQRYILAMFYFATQEALKDTNWLSTSSECLWQGVSCYSHNAVIIGIELSNMSLQGTLPEEISKLKDLKILDLSENDLNGRLFSFENLNQLETLNLSNNKLQDALPQNMNNLKSLTFCELSNNKLIGSIPPSLGNLPHLAHLHLNDNQFDGFFPFEALQNAPKLQVIRADNNFLEGGIPSSLTFDYLQILSLSNNLFVGSLPKFTYFHSLTVLNLSQNSFESISSDVDALPPNLSELQLQNNKFQGDFDSICNVTQIDIFKADCSDDHVDDEYFVACDCCTECF